MDEKARIRELEDELRKTPYNKRTQGHIGLVKAKIARLKEKLEKKSRGKGKHKPAVKKSGDATVAIVGFPSVGKSTLLNALTNADSKTADYPFTTVNVVPGLLKYKNAKIQLLDVPGIIEGAAKGVGRGKEALSVVQSADLILIVVDAQDISQLGTAKQELYKANFRLNEEKPDVVIRPAARGGIELSTTKLSRLNEQTVRDVLREFRISNAYVIIREDISVERLIDAIEGNRKYLPAIVVVNKIDLLDEEKISEAKKIGGAVLVSAAKGTNLDALKEEIFKKLNLLRIFLKEAGKKADLKEPLIMRRSCAVRDVCLKLHKDFANKFRFARVWGKSAKFAGQKVGLEHTLKDEDVVQIHLR
jgi:hypothetical protein